MGKKKDDGGAPAYMGLFTSLMTVLLAFFILMVSMADKQDAGFYHGIGSVQNALGMTGGLGVLGFARAAGETGVLGVEEDQATDDKTQHQLNPEGDRGLGTTDLDDVDYKPQGKYIKIFIPHTFEAGMSQIKKDSKLEKYLNNVSISFIANEAKIGVRVYAQDGGNADESRKLALKRAQTICNVMNQNGIDFTRLTATGYSHDRYFKFEEQIQRQISQTKQAAYFYFYQANN